MINQTIDFKNYKIQVIGQFADRQYIANSRHIINLLEKRDGLNIHRGRFFELPFVYTNILGCGKKVLDIGSGNTAFADVLKDLKCEVTCVDNYETCWKDLSPEDTTKVVKGDCRDLNMFDNDIFDCALLVSVIEHIPTNLIFWDGKLKEGSVVKEENGERQKAISEALRVIKIGGKVILTTDYYIDHPIEMNLSMHDLLEVKGLEIEDMTAISDQVYVFDLPHHKGRIVHVGLVITKLGRNV